MRSYPLFPCQYSGPTLHKIEVHLTFTLNLEVNLNNPLFYGMINSVMNMNDIYDCRILIVDDEPELRKMVKDILQKAGFQRVITAATCKQARQMFSAEQPEGVILDVMLPDGDGFLLMREFRMTSPAPVLFLSARDEDEDRLLGLGLGADDYITKPFLPRELVLRLQAVLNRVYFPAVLKKAAKPAFTLGNTEIDLNSGTVTTPQQPLHADRQRIYASGKVV